MAPLTKHCGNCAHFDGDCHCTLPAAIVVIPVILEPTLVVCAMHEDKREGEEA